MTAAPAIDEPTVTRLARIERIRAELAELLNDVRERESQLCSLGSPVTDVQRWELDPDMAVELRLSVAWIDATPEQRAALREWWGERFRELERGVW